MRLTGCDEQERAGFHRRALRAIEEHAVSTCNDIDLVPRMRLLEVGSIRCVQLDLERAVGEDRHRQIAGRWRPFGERLAKTYVSGSNRCHAHGGAPRLVVAVRLPARRARAVPYR